MVKWLLIIILLLPVISAAENNCAVIYDFIIENYNCEDQRLEFTDDDFDLLQLKTTMLPIDLKNHVMYYDDLCDQELPFLDYNNQWPAKEIKLEPEKQPVKKGFSDFTETIKGDAIIIFLVLLAIIAILWFVNEYS